MPNRDVPPPWPVGQSATVRAPSAGKRQIQTRGNAVSRWTFLEEYTPRTPLLRMIPALIDNQKPKKAVSSKSAASQARSDCRVAIKPHIPDCSSGLESLCASIHFQL